MMNGSDAIKPFLANQKPKFSLFKQEIKKGFALGKASGSLGIASVGMVRFLPCL